MAKKIDITEKLKFEENPSMIIKGISYEVDAGATTMLKVMGLLGDGENITAQAILEMYNCIFSEKERNKLDKLHLKFEDLQTVIKAAVDLVTGDTDQGE